MPNLTPVARAYGTYRSSNVRVSRQVGEAALDPSAWERRDRFVRGGPNVTKGADRLQVTPPQLVGDDAVWERIQRAFKKHDDPYIRAFFAAEIIRKLPNRQRLRMTNEFWEQYPFLIPMFLLNTWAPDIEAIMDTINKVAKEFWQTVVSDFSGLLAPHHKKETKTWNSNASATPPVKRR